MSFATEGEAKQQRVEQQREQQRIRQSPVLRAHAVAVGTSLEPGNLVVLGRRCLDTAAGAGHEHKMLCAPHDLTGHQDEMPKVKNRLLVGLHAFFG